jgi:pilus assembly protein Flp/PilA
VAKILAVLKNRAGDESGATMVEYALMLALIAIVCVTAVGSVGSAASIMFNSISASL